MGSNDVDREALARDARDLRARRYDCECQVGGVDATSIDADYLHEVGKRIDRLLAARGDAATPTVTAEQAWSEGHRTGWEHCQDGNYGTDAHDDDTPNPYARPSARETVRGCPICWDLGTGTICNACGRDERGGR